jgi:hypothetical protein
MMLQPLFTTARVITATYRIISTTMLLIYIAKRIKDGRETPRNGRRADELYNRARH